MTVKIKLIHLILKKYIIQSFFLYSKELLANWRNPELVIESLLIEVKQKCN